jgi:hypothetical protein
MFSEEALHQFSTKSSNPANLQNLLRKEPDGRSNNVQDSVPVHFNKMFGAPRSSEIQQTLEAGARSLSAEVSFDKHFAAARPAASPPFFSCHTQVAKDQRGHVGMHRENGGSVPHLTSVKI